MAPEANDIPSLVNPANEPVEVIRSEEQLRVRTVATPHTRLRIRKVIVTEERTITVTVRREQFEVTEERIDAGDGLADDARALEPLHDEQIELVLHEEQIEVTHRVVPVERVLVDKRVITVSTPVTDDVRRERIDVTQD